MIVMTLQWGQSVAFRVQLDSLTTKHFDIDLVPTDHPMTVFVRLYDILVDPVVNKDIFAYPMSQPANESFIINAVMILGVSLIKELNIGVHPYSPHQHFMAFMRNHYQGLPPANEMGLIFGKYATDKNIMGHNYVNIYHQYLQPYRDSAIRYLELGSLYGSSLYAFREYFPLATALVGVDRNQVQLTSKVGENGIGEEVDDDKLYIEVGDQTDAVFLEDVNRRLGPFDIILDDCSHVSALTIRSFEILFPLLKDNGLYIVEDVSWEENRDALDYFFKLSRSLYRDRTAYGGDDNSDPWKSAHRVSDPIEYSVDEVIFASSVVIIRKKIKHHWIVPTEEEEQEAG